MLFRSPALTTIAVQQAEIGRLAFQSIWSMMNDSPGADYEVKTNLVIRQTTAAAPSAATAPSMKKEISHA